MASPTRLYTTTKLITLVEPGKDFLTSEVPTLRAVIQQGIKMQEDSLHINITKNNYPLKSMAKDLVPLIQAQWKKSNDSFIPPVIKNDKTIADIIVAKWNTLSEIARNKASGRKKLLSTHLTNYLIFLLADVKSFCAMMKILIVMDAV